MPAVCAGTAGGYTGWVSRRAPGDQLTAYRKKRDFARTPEPSGGGRAPDRGRFVVQRHRARRLHYDFRLEVNGVLASWAVPKGPTLDPAARRLAVHVEDHPIEYADFEGVIPTGEYGGGDVIVWDRGTWAPVDTDDPAGAIAKGELHFDLDGQKLKGRFILVRTGRPGDGDREQWLLLHKRDEFAQPGWDVEAHPESVKSGRSNEEIAAHPDAMWDSNAPPEQAEVQLHDQPPAPRGASPKEIAALDALPAEGAWQVQGRELHLANLDKVLWAAGPEAPAVTKRDLIRYYVTSAPFLLPYLVGRPVNLRRFPDGVDERGLWQKDAPSGAPDWITRWHYPYARAAETQRYLVVDSTAALAWVANHGAIELHPWASLADAPERPTWAFVDIDPGSASTFAQVVDIARLFRTALGHLGIEGRPKLSGQAGIEVWIPVAARYTFAETCAWVEQLSRAVGNSVPELVSWEERTSARRGRARLDFTQNAVRKTLVAPFSPRPVHGATVSVPITWDELDGRRVRPDQWTIHTIGRRLRRVGDPLRPLIGLQQQLPSLS